MKYFHFIMQRHTIHQHVENVKINQLNQYSPIVKIKISSYQAPFLINGIRTSKKKSLFGVDIDPQE